MVSHNYWMWSSTLISNSFAFKPLIISLNYFIIKKENLRRVKKENNSGFSFLQTECSWFIFKKSKMREELHLLLQFEAQGLILSPYEYLNNSCALLFWNSEYLCVRELKSVAYHHNRNAKLFLSPGKDVTLFYTLILFFFWVSQRILQETWAKVTSAIVSKSQFHCLFKDFPSSRHVCSQSSNSEPSQAGSKEESFFWEKKKVYFYPSILLRQDFIKMWKEAANVGKEEWIL